MRSLYQEHPITTQVIGKHTCEIQPCDCGYLGNISLQEFIDLLSLGVVQDCTSPALFRKNCHTSRGFSLLPLYKFDFYMVA